MLSLISFCCREFGWSWEYVVEDARLLSLMLLARQKAHEESDTAEGFTLLEQERMDAERGVPWEELVRRNRERLAASMPGVIKSRNPKG